MSDSRDWEGNYAYCLEQEEKEASRQKRLHLAKGNLVKNSETGLSYVDCGGGFTYGQGDAINGITYGGRTLAEIQYWEAVEARRRKLRGY